MPTKPLTQPEYWATDLVYTTGPFIGQPQKVVPPAAFAAEGHRPGSLFPTPAEYENSQQYNLTGLVRWLFLGTSAPDPDAHVVETDSTGRAGLHGLDVNDTVDETAVDITAVSTLAPAMLVTNTSGGGCIQADMGNASSAGFVVQTGTGASAIGNSIVMASTPTGGRGVLISADASTAGRGMRIEHAGSGLSLEIVDTGNKASAVNISTANNARALTAAGSGLGVGILGQSGNTAGANAIQADLLNNDGFGFSCTTPLASSTSCRAGYFEARGSAIGVEAVASGHYALLIEGDATTPQYAAMRFIGANDRPAIAAAGSIGYDNVENQFLVGDTLDNAYRGVWTSTNGKAIAYTASADGAQNTAQTAGTINWQTAATAAATNGNAPKVASAEAVLRFRCMARNVTAPGPGGNYFGVKFYDATAAGDITGSVRNGIGNADTDGFYLPNDQEWYPVVYDFRFPVPAAGDRTWEARIIATAATEVRVRDCSLTLDGLY